MRTAQIVQIVCWCIVAVLCVSALAIGLNGGELFGHEFNFSFGINYMDYKSNFNGTISESGTETFAANDITDISVSWIGGNVQVIPHGESYVKIVQTGNGGSIDEDRKMKFNLENGLLRIREGDKNRLQIRTNSHTNLTIYLPEDLNHMASVTISVASAGVKLDKAMRIEDIVVDNVSGTSEINGIEAYSLKTEAVSGRILLTNVSADGDIKLNTISGGIELNNVKADNIRNESVSGRQTGTGITAALLRNESISGNIEFAGEINAFNVNSTSGKVTLSSSVCPGEIDVETISGRVDITIPENEGFSLDYSTISGKVECDFDSKHSSNKMTHGTGRAKFNIETVSGGITIRKS